MKTKRSSKPRGKTTPGRRKPTNARAAAKTVEQKIERIAYLMIKGKWSVARIPGLAKAWGVTGSAVAKLADKAGVKVELAEGKLATKIASAEADLEAIMREARAAGQYTAAVRAVEARMKLAGAYSEHRPGRGKPQQTEEPQGLPPELAVLVPPPSPVEVEHFASTRPEDCAVEGCRVHGKAAPSPGAVH